MAITTTSINLQFKNKAIVLKEIELTPREFDILKCALESFFSTTKNAIIELQNAHLRFIETEAYSQLNEIEELYAKIES